MEKRDYKEDHPCVDSMPYKEIIAALKHDGSITYIYRKSVSLYKTGDKTYYAITMAQFNRLKKEGLIVQNMGIKRVDEYIASKKLLNSPTHH